MKNKTNFFKALSDIQRLRILKMLQTRPLCVCEIQSVLNLAVSTVSQHLKILREAGFIIEEKDGKWVNYHINQKPSDERIKTFLSSLDFWIGDENLIISDLKKAKCANRIKICS